MTEPIDARSERTLWTFPAGALDAHDSVKGYDVQCSDGRLGTVSWADFKPGESYLVVSYRSHLREMHHVVPAGAIAQVDHAARTVTPTVSTDEVRSSPEHEEPRLGRGPSRPPDRGARRDPRGSRMTRGRREPVDGAPPRTATRRSRRAGRSDRPVATRSRRR